MTIKRYTYLIIYVIATLLFVACSTDDPEQNGEGKMTHVTMSIGTRAATGTPELPSVDVEKIRSWWVVFVDRNGIVRAVVKRPVDRTNYVEEEKVELDVPTGTYTLYSFANIAPTASSAGSVTIAGFTFTEGTAKPSGIDAATYDLTNGYTGDIPMTGKQSVTVTGRSNEVFSVEVVRMYAKMEFQFNNQSQKNVTVNTLTITQVQKTPVSLLPNYTWLDDGWPLANLSTAATNLIRTYNGSPLSAISLNAKGGTTTTATDVFYMIESQADYSAPSQSYLMTLNITRNGLPAENLYFMLDANWTSIYRNDHVIIPLTITDYTVELDANFYPPIGGYPAIITADKDKEEFYITFKTQGEFEIMPTVYNASTGTNVYYPNWDYNSSTISVTGATGIFTTLPHIDTTTGEILGKLSTTEGTAVIDVKIKVEVSSGVWQVYPRRIYIIRSNA